MKPHKKRPYLTTGQIAKICGVAPRTASKWIDSGALRGWRIPGSRDRRVSPAEVLRFLKDNNLPLDGLRQATCQRVLLVGCRLSDSAYHGFALALGEDWEVVWAASPLEAGLLAASEPFEVLIVDLSIGRDDGCRCAGATRALGIKPIALCSEDESENEIGTLMYAGFSAALKKPFAAVDLAKLVNGAVAPAPRPLVSLRSRRGKQIA